MLMKQLLTSQICFNVSLHRDDIQDFDSRWDQAILSASEVPKENVLERFVLDDNT